MHTRMTGYMENDKHFATKALHVGQEPEQWNSLAVVPPIQALTSTRGYSLPVCLNYYPYPTRNFFLPDRVEGSEENSIIYKSKEWKCNTFVMMDIFIIPRNSNFTLQLCQSPFIYKSIIKFIKTCQPCFSER